MSSDAGDSSLFLALPDDVISIISRSLLPKDLCNLSLSCKNLCALVASEKIWITQCEMVGIVAYEELLEWRKAMSSYKALCRFLVGVKPLIGIWAHQNPELGNVVYVMSGFASVVGCRIIPQEVGPLGIEEGPLLWAPVFEIISDSDGSAIFYLHGREKGFDYGYPGSVKAVEKNCNVLLLEVQPKERKNGSKVLLSNDLAHHPDTKTTRTISRSDNRSTRLQRDPGQSKTTVPFNRLAFRDRRRLLEIVTSHVRLQVPESSSGPLFPRLQDETENFREDVMLLLKRRSLLLNMHKLGGNYIHGNTVPELDFDPTQLDVSEVWKDLGNVCDLRASCNEDHVYTQNPMRKTVGGYFKSRIRHILGMSASTSDGCHALKNSSSSSNSRHAQLPQFLNSGETIGLSLHASTARLSSYHAWPNMHDSSFALYKLPIRIPSKDHEFAGLWGGTFGWPLEKPSEDKPGKTLFLLLLSYEESRGERLLIATKILEGTQYVLHPNGSAMFTVNIDQPSLDAFPWGTNAADSLLAIKHAFTGVGIANGYGFRYPGSRPGSLFVMHNGLLAFVWKESRAVLTLQRLNLQDLLRKGKQVPPLPPTCNFSYLTKSYSNVFYGFSNSPMHSSLPRR